MLICGAGPPPGAARPRRRPRPPRPRLDPGARVATGQAPVVGGNAAGARERALEDAIRQAVDQAITELADPQTRAAQAKAIRALEAKARSFVGQLPHARGGRDERRLHRAHPGRGRRGRASGAGSSAGRRRAAAPAPPAGRRAVDRRAGRGRAPAPDVRRRAGRRAVRRGRARAGRGRRSRAPAGASATVAADDARRGGAARHGARLGRLPGDRAGSPALRCPSAPPPPARSPRRAERGPRRLSRPAGRRAGGSDLASTLGGAAAAAGGDLPVLTIDADVVEPAAVVGAAQERPRGGGGLGRPTWCGSAAGTPRFAPAPARPPGRLAAALSRDADAMISLSDVQTAGGVIRLRARLRAPAAEPGRATP